MRVNFKKSSEDAVIPSYGKPGDAGLDLTATTITVEQPGFEEGEGVYVEYGTGLSVEIPEGHVGLIFPRSSISSTDLILANSVGVVDSGYRGEIKCRFKLNGDYWHVGLTEDNEVFYYLTAEDEYRERGMISAAYKIGDRVAQLVIIPYPTIEVNEVEELSESERGDSGFGSTGR